MKQNGIYIGRTEILYNYGRYGYTRGNGFLSTPPSRVATEVTFYNYKSII